MIFNSNNSTLRVERRKRGNAQRASSSSHEAEGDRELSSAGVRTRGRRPRILTARESNRPREWRPETVGRGLSPCEITFSRNHFRPSAANFTRVCMTAFASRCVYYFIRWGHWNWRLEWLQLLLACGGRRDGRGSTCGGRRGGPGRSLPRRGGGGGGGRPSRNVLKMFHKQFSSRNEAWFVKLRRQMTTEKNTKFTLNINYSLYSSKSICFSHTFVYHRSILY